MIEYLTEQEVLNMDTNYIIETKNLTKQYGSQKSVDDEWTPVNTSPNATQGHAVESNFAPGRFGGWADLSASPIGMLLFSWV